MIDKPKLNNCISTNSSVSEILNALEKEFARLETLKAKARKLLNSIYQFNKENDK